MTNSAAPSGIETFSNTQPLQLLTNTANLRPPDARQDSARHYLTHCSRARSHA